MKHKSNEFGASSLEAKDEILPIDENKKQDDETKNELPNDVPPKSLASKFLDDFIALP
ncbi:MAG: hypothetical protein FWC76_00365 [Defluviitaleaceae bacterium]|nr:hypothetical protein [Defluviitaleaceae bacterium]